MHRVEDHEATFEGEINGTISVGLREADLDKRDRYRSKVYEPLAEEIRFAEMRSIKHIDQMENASPKTTEEMN